MPDFLSHPLRVFLCHAHSDAAAVHDLYLRLTKDGVDAWLDKETILPGQDWEYEVRKAVREVDVVIVCLSKQFNQAGYRQKEVRLALDTAMEQPEGEIFIIPARLDECDTLESLRKWHWVNLFEEDGYEMLMRALKYRHRQRLQSQAEERAPAESMAVPVSIAEKPTTPKTTSGGRVIYTFGDIEFVKVPAGKFLMGSGNEVRQADDDEKPHHFVDLSYS